MTRRVSRDLRVEITTEQKPGRLTYVTAEDELVEQICHLFDADHSIEDRRRGRRPHPD